MVEVLAECWEVSRDEALELIIAIRATKPDLEALSRRPHLHLKVWGQEPDAAPHYYEIPFR